MVQCSYCDISHHLECVGLLQSDTIGVWPCPRCRVHSDMLHQWHKILQEITSQLASLQLLQDNVPKNMGSLAQSKNVDAKMLQKPRQKGRHQSSNQHSQSEQNQHHQVKESQQKPFKERGKDNNHVFASSSQYVTFVV